jgi:hypothetical protein
MCEMPSGRLVIYCLVPREATGVASELRRHYREDPRIEVIVERRLGERADGAPETERRRQVVPRNAAPLPEALAARTQGVRWVQRMVPVSGELLDLETAGLVARHRDGDPGAAAELYWRSFERLHSRLSVLTGSAERADELAPEAFGRVLDGVEDPSSTDDSFETILYRQVDAFAQARVEAEPVAPPLVEGITQRAG